jgi:hypothetical protein
VQQHPTRPPVQQPTRNLAQALLPDEAVVAHDVGLPARISILIPTYKDNAGALISALTALEGAANAEIVLFDDGSADSSLTEHHRTALRTHPGSYALVQASRNRGRAHARNRLAALASSPWLLYLDADMLPDDGHFLNRYFQALSALGKPGLIVGGFSLRGVKRRPANALHHAQSVASDCLSAEQRARDPGRYVFTSNLLVHRSIIETVAFDPGFKGWGWEDVDWGLRVAATNPVHHIDNTAAHHGLIMNEALIRRFETSGDNFARLSQRHPEACSRMALTRAIRIAGRLPFQSLSRAVMRTLARDPVGLTPMPVRLLALKWLRAMHYAQSWQAAKVVAETEGYTP